MTTLATIAKPGDVYLSRLARRLAPGVPLSGAVREAREWMIECGNASEDLDEVIEYVDSMTDSAVVMWVARNYAGGLNSFARSI